MSRWRAEAISRLPEHRKLIENAEGMMALWIELCLLFERAYASPADSDLIRKIYEYARWCCNRPRVDDPGDDPLTCVCCAFFEHIPTIPAAHRDMHHWFTVSDVLESKGVFSYLIGDDDFENLVSEMRVAARTSVTRWQLRPD
jgi:hypothetical protein